MGVEKNPEVVGCGASIMRNVWEIRVLEHRQRTLLERERLERSALPSINKDWASRMTAKTNKTVERKVKPAETQTDENIWKSKKPPTPQTVPQGRGPLGRPGVKGLSSPASKRQDRSFNRSQLLMSITQTQPSSLVWGRAWRFNRSVPSPTEGSTTSSDWGQSWMFATHQPASEGQLWPNEPNLVDPHSLHLWRRRDDRMVDPQEPDLSLSTEEWQESWKRFYQIVKVESVNEENVLKQRFFTSLLQNETSSEWVNSWQSTKPSNHQDHGPVPDEGPMNVSDGREMSSGWDKCWRLVNHNDSRKSTMHQVNRSLSPEWDSSWRSTSGLSSDPSQNQVLNHGFDDPNQQKEPLFNKTISTFHIRDLQLCSKPEVLTEWNQSWQITKNNSRPSEELDEVIKALPPDLDSEFQTQKNPKLDTDLRYERLKDGVINYTKRRFPQRKLLVSLPSSEWRSSWKMIQHRMRPERRRYRPDPGKTLRASEEDVKWKDSWKLTCQLLNQNPDPWQQGWPTSTQIHENRRRRLRGFLLVGFPKNGPTGERTWGESWKFSRHQHQSEPVQDQEPISKEKPLKNVLELENQSGSVSDWQDAWRVSETLLHHDRPSFCQWREAWRWSIYHRTEHGSTRRWIDDSMEIQPLRTSFSSQTRTSFKKQTYPENKWSSSWRAGSVLNFLLSSYDSRESGSKWGRSFRLANPAPELDQPWTESRPNPRQHAVLWSRRNKTQNKSDLKKPSSAFTVWVNSHRFLQSADVRFEAEPKSEERSDPKVILTQQIQTKERLFSSVEKEKRADRKWAGSHLLSKTQPRPEKGSVGKIQPEEKLLEGWKESWKFFVQPEGLRNLMSFNFLSGWDESWKFLLPPY